VPSTHPVCDKHKSLQMIPCVVERPTGWVSGHVCPVPGCGRHRDEDGYFDIAEPRVPAPEKQNKQAAARAEIMRMIRAIRAQAETDLKWRQQK
jgi:hypothetical protein